MESAASCQEYKEGEEVRGLIVTKADAATQALESQRSKGATENLNRLDMKPQLAASKIFYFCILGRCFLDVEVVFSEKFRPAIGWIRLEVALQNVECIQTSRDLGIKVC